jgi:hypothetical protein
MTDNSVDILHSVHDLLSLPDLYRVRKITLAVGATRQRAISAAVFSTVVPITAAALRTNRESLERAFTSISSLVPIAVADSPPPAGAAKVIVELSAHTSGCFGVRVLVSRLVYQF